mmetsp:Transcript_22764/g.47558  ORF Transcript_22764/g.47558 Transcript_22764/m.47558 type:complete len:675 (+) Transcript_22764:234-2258(+)
MIYEPASFRTEKLQLMMENYSQPLNREVSNSSTFSNPNNNNSNNIQASNHDRHGNEKSSASNSNTSKLSSKYSMNLNNQTLNSGDPQEHSHHNFSAISGQRENNTDSSSSIPFGKSTATTSSCPIEPYCTFPSSNDTSRVPTCAFGSSNPLFCSTAIKSDDFHSMNSSSSNFCTTVSASIAASTATLRANFNAAASSNATASAASARNQQNAFLYDLFDIISDPYNNEIISWLPHGKGFIINNKNRFERLILPDFLPSTKYASFTRRLKRWKFFRVPSGVEMGAYYHRCFRRGHPHLIHLVNTNDDTTAQQHGWNLGTIATTASAYPTGISLQPITNAGAIASAKFDTDSLLAKIAKPPSKNYNYDNNPNPNKIQARPSSSASSMSDGKRKASFAFASENYEDKNKAETHSDNTSAAVQDVRDFPQIMRDISKAKRLESITSRRKNRSNSQNFLETNANAVFPTNINRNPIPTNQSQIISLWDDGFSSSPVEPIPFCSQQFQASNLMNTDMNMNMTSNMITMLQSHEEQEQQHQLQPFARGQGFESVQLTNQPHQPRSHPQQPNDNYFIQNQYQNIFSDSTQLKQEFNNINSGSTFNNSSHSSYPLSSELCDMMSQQQQLQQQFEQFQQRYQPQPSVMNTRDQHSNPVNNGDGNGSINNQDDTDQSFSVFARSA